MSDELQPPPRRADVKAATARKPAEKTRWQKFSTSLFEKGAALNDWAAGYVNHVTESACMEC